MADQRLNPDKIDWSSAIKEMRNEGMNDDAIHKEISGEFGSTIADQHLQRGKFAPVDNAEKKVAPVWGEGWDKVENTLPWELPAAVAAGGAAVHYGSKILNRGTEALNKVHGSLRDLMTSKSGDDGLLANQQAEKAIQQANMSAKEATALQTPTTETPLDTKVKPLNPVEGTIVEQGAANTEAKAATQALDTSKKAQAKLVESSPEGYKPNYSKSAKNPIGPGMYNWIYGQEGPKSAAVYRDIFGETNVPYSEANKEKYLDYKRGVPEPAYVYSDKPGGTNKRPTHVPQYIRGSISPSAAINLAGNSLGAAGLVHDYAQGKKTGDWSNLGLDAISQVIANIAPRAALPLALMNPSSVSSGTLDSPEAKELMEKAKKKQGIAPPLR